MSLLRQTAIWMLAALAETIPRYGDPQRVLLIRPDHLGDLLFVTPTLRFLRQSLPDTHLAMLVGPWSRPIVASNPNLDEVLECDFPWFNRQPRSSALGPYKLLWQQASLLRQRRYGAAVNLRPDFWWGTLLSSLAGIPRRVGCDLSLVRPALTEAVPCPSDEHAVWQNLRLASVLSGQSLEGFQPALEFLISEEARERARHFLARQGVNDTGCLVAIQPGSGAPIKSWGTAGFVEVATHIQQRYACQVVITGSADEYPLAQAIAIRMSQPPIIATGETDIEGLAALLQRCRLAVGVDSGPMHLAAAVGTPTVSLYGPASVKQFGPFGPPEKHLVVKASLPCIPCGELSRPLPPAGVADCMQALSSDLVIEAVDAIMGLA